MKARSAAGIDWDRLTAAIDDAFREPPSGGRNTLAVVVLRDAQLVTERYAPGITERTPLPGWSMTKAVANALVGISIHQGHLALEDTAPIPEWRGPGDLRARITINDLLRMTSGLRFDEDYQSALSDVNVMLFGSSDGSLYALTQPLVAEPGTRWSYASGSTNILMRILRHLHGFEAALTFPRHELFDRLGMQSATFEPDASGVFVGSSFMFATARDWARLGMLYLSDGVWAGERILPKGWVSYTRAASAGSPLGQYGAHFWTNAGSSDRREDRAWPKLPYDAFFAFGFRKQSMSIIPSRRLVIVRLGRTLTTEAWDHERFVAGIVGAFSDE